MSARTNAQPRLGIHLILTDDLDLIIQVEGGRIVVRSPRGTFRVTYKKPLESSQLVLDSEWWSKGSLRSLVHLRARAWRLANDAATELGLAKLAGKLESKAKLTARPRR